VSNVLQGWIPIQLTGVAFPQSISNIYYDPSSSLYRWNDGSYYYIAATLGRQLSLSFSGGSGQTFTLSGSYYGNAIYGGSGYYTWKSPDFWVVSALPGTYLAEYQFFGSDGLQHYSGDSWWSGLALDSSLSGSGTPRGSNNGTSNTLSFSWNLPASYWRYDSSLDCYSPQGSATGYKFFGELVLTDDHGGTYVQQPPSTVSPYKSVLKNSNNYGDINWNSSAWIIGTFSTAPLTGYWQGPSTLPIKKTDSSVTFTRIWNGGGTDPFPYNLTVSFNAWDTATSSRKFQLNTYQSSFAEFL
jgi:hypothetical protein